MKTAKMDDLISREMAIANAYNVVIDGSVFKVVQVETLYGLPTIEPKRGKWTLCKEELPKTNGRYIVTRGLNACGALWNRVYILNYSDLMGTKSERIWWQGNVGKSDFERIDDVLAWMPLPNPYKEKDNE